MHALACTLGILALLGGCSLGDAGPGGDDVDDTTVLDHTATGRAPMWDPAVAACLFRAMR